MSFVIVGIAIAAGALQVWLLTRFTNAVMSGKVRVGTVFAGLAQFLLPLGVLVLPATRASRTGVVTMGVAMAATLIVGTVAVFVWRTKRTGKEE